MASKTAFRFRLLAAVSVLFPLLASTAVPAGAAVLPASVVQTTAAVPSAAANWLEARANWQHNSFNRFETQLGVRNVRSLHAALTISARPGEYLSMPTIAGDKMYFGVSTEDREQISVEARDVRSGRLAWRRTVPASLSPGAGQPKYLNGRVYVTYSGGVTPSSLYDSTIALDARTGRRLWEVSGRADVVGYGQIFVRAESCDSGGCTEFRITAYDAATGEVVWSRAVLPDYEFAGGFTGAVLHDGIAYFGEDNALGSYRLRAVDARTGTPRWSTTTTAVPTPVAIDVATGIVLVNEGDTVRAVVGRTGRVLWSRTGRFDVVAIGQGTIFAVCWSTHGARVCVHRLSDGAPVASIRPPTCQVRPNLWSGLALANGVLYATSSECGVVAINTTTNRSLGTLVPGTRLGHPEVVRGRLYTGNGSQVTVWQP